MLERVASYFNYLAKATNAHGLHSPFLFKLYKEVIKTAPRVPFDDIESLRKKLQADKTQIEFLELGAGINPVGGTKSISSIARRSSQRKKYCQLIANLVKHFKSNQILELGTSLGITTCYLAKANPSSRIVSMEGNLKVLERARKNLDSLEIHNVELIHGNFDDSLKTTVESFEKLDLVYFDGNHQKTPTLNYFNICLDKKHPDSIFIFDDIHWSREMEEAWNTIKDHPDVTVTIDLFQFGIVFFREGQAKEHFVVRF